METHWLGNYAYPYEGDEPGKLVVWSSCGLDVTSKCYSDDANKVTCKRCERSIEKHFYPDGR